MVRKRGRNRPTQNFKNYFLAATKKVGEKSLFPAIDDEIKIFIKDDPVCHNAEVKSGTGLEKFMEILEREVGYVPRTYVRKVSPQRQAWGDASSGPDIQGRFAYMRSGNNVELAQSCFYFFVMRREETDHASNIEARVGIDAYSDSVTYQPAKKGSGTEPSSSILDLIEKEADMESLVLYPSEDSSRELVETNLEHKTNADAPHVKLGEWFRLVVEQDLRGFDILVLQNANALWGNLPWQADDASGQIFIPGRHPNGEHVLLRERHLSDKSLFLVMATKVAIPPKFKDVHRNRSTFDSTLLGAAAEFFCGQPKNERRIFALWVQIGEVES